MKKQYLTLDLSIDVTDDTDVITASITLDTPIDDVYGEEF